MLLSEKLHTIQVVILNLIVISLQACTPFIIYKLTQLIDETSENQADIATINNTEIAFNQESTTMYASLIAQIGIMSAQLYKISKIGLLWAFVLFIV